MKNVSNRVVKKNKTHILCSVHTGMWAGQHSQYSDQLRAGRSGGSNPGGGEIFHTCPDWPWGPPSLLYNGYWVFPGGKERPGCDADPSPPSSAVGHERVELRVYVPLLPLWAVWPVQSLSACTRVHLTLPLHTGMQQNICYTNVKL